MEASAFSWPTTTPSFGTDSLRLLEQPDLALAAEAENGARAVELYRELHPDVCLIDL
jgi:DNA-binding NarL/FixJ family response regulator